MQQASHTSHQLVSPSPLTATPEDLWRHFLVVSEGGGRRGTSLGNFLVSLRHWDAVALSGEPHPLKKPLVKSERRLCQHQVFLIVMKKDCQTLSLSEETHLECKPKDIKIPETGATNRDFLSQVRGERHS